MADLAQATKLIRLPLSQPFMFGDSVMLIQIRELKKQYNGTGQYGRWLEVEGVHLNSGLPVNMAKANASIESAALYHKATGGAAAIWFNSGLHDIDKFCGTAWR